MAGVGELYIRWRTGLTPVLCRRCTSAKACDGAPLGGCRTASNSLYYMRHLQRISEELWVCQWFGRLGLWFWLVELDEHATEVVKVLLGDPMAASGPTAHESDPPRRSASTQESGRDDLLVQQSAQFMTITLGVFLGRFAYDLAALAVVRDKPEALAGSLRAVAR
jgi:hypothetical protein